MNAPQPNSGDDISEQRFLNISEVAEILRVSNKFVYKLLDEKKMSHYQFGNRKLIQQKDLEEYIASCRVQTK